MNILVSIKPDLPGQGLGRFEALALEAGLGLRQVCDRAGQRESRVDVITAGPDRYRQALYRALGMGADQALHIRTEPLQQADGHDLTPPSVTAARLAHAVRSRHYDLILFGVLSQDLMAGQTGPMAAAYLGWPCIPSVVRLGLAGKDQWPLTLVRELDSGAQETLSLSVPAVLTIQASDRPPRYPTLSHMLRAKKKSILTLTPDPVLPLAATEVCLGLESPEKTRAGILVQAGVAGQVRALKTFLAERHLG